MRSAARGRCRLSSPVGSRDRARSRGEGTLDARKQRNLNILGLVIGCVLGGVLIYSEESGVHPFRSPVFAIAAIAGPGLLLTLLALPARIRSWREGRIRPAPRLDRPRVEAIVVTHLVLPVVVGGLFLREGAFTPEDLGFKVEVPAPAAFLAGLGAYLLLGTAYGVVADRWLGEEGRARQFLRAMRAFVPRDRAVRSRVIAFILVNPFVEEIVWRGVLLALPGRLTGQPMALAVAGLPLWLAAHLYQGPRGIPWQAGFYVTAVALLLSPLGMWGCLGLHVAGDVLPMLRIRGMFAELRAHRALRAAAATRGERGPAEERSVPGGSR